VLDSQSSTPTPLAEVKCCKRSLLSAPGYERHIRVLLVEHVFDTCVHMCANTAAGRTSSWQHANVTGQGELRPCNKDTAARLQYDTQSTNCNSIAINRNSADATAATAATPESMLAHP
jgi:hypothetical protein